MKSKKGFTVVELVIVIAIIAILATALIPTFGGLIESANLTKDQQAVRNMNTDLVLATVEGEIKTAGDAIDALMAAGFYGDKLTTFTKNHHYAYNLESNTMYIVSSKGEVVFPADDGVELSSLWGIYRDHGNDYVDGIIKYVATTSLDNAYDFNQEFTGSSYVIDMNGKAMLIDATNKANIELINARTGITGYKNMADDDVMVTYSGFTTSTENGVTGIKGDENGNVTVENVIINLPADRNNIPVSSTGNVTFKNCVFTAPLLIDDSHSNFGSSNVTITIENCTFVGDTSTYGDSYSLAVQNFFDANVTLNIVGNTFDGGARAIMLNTCINLDATVENNTFNMAVDEESNAAVRLGQFSTITGDGDGGQHVNKTTNNKLTVKNNTMTSGEMLVRCPVADLPRVTISGNTLGDGIAETAE